MSNKIIQDIINGIKLIPKNSDMSSIGLAMRMAVQCDLPKQLEGPELAHTTRHLQSGEIETYPLKQHSINK